MSVLTTTLVGLAFAGAVGALAAREHQLARAARRSLLDRCANVLDGADIRHGGDGFPRLVGLHGRRSVCLELIPDTMVMRRLPQLWASLTVLGDFAEVPSLAVLVRAAGYEFYSLTGALTYVLDPPAVLPPEVLVRGSDARAEALLHHLAPRLAAVLVDPKVKEIAVTRRGLRVIWQVGEGRRGEHLLLRQAVFDDADMAASDLVKRLDELDMVRSAIGTRGRKRAA